MDPRGHCSPAWGIDALLGEQPQIPILLPVVLQSCSLHLEASGLCRVSPPLVSPGSPGQWDRSGVRGADAPRGCFGEGFTSPLPHHLSPPSRSSIPVESERGWHCDAAAGEQRHQPQEPPVPGPWPWQSPEAGVASCTHRCNRELREGSRD